MGYNEKSPHYPAFTVPVARPTQEDRRSVSVLVCSYSSGTEDARDILSVLGLLEEADR